MAQPDPGLALIADIGGTNARFALAEPDANGAIRLTSIRTLSTGSFDTLADAGHAYVEAVKPEPRPRIAAVAVAAPVTGELVTLTNGPWTFSISETRRRLHVERFEVMNDFAAIARSLPHLQAEDLHPVGERQGAEERRTAGVLAAVGPGTGLGVGALISRGGRVEAIASEGGHISFAPGDVVETEIARCLLKQFPHVSYERLISGPGLRNLYRALAEIEGTQAEILTPTEIAEQGVAGQDALCRRAMERFCAILGAFAGDVALMYGADRVYLAGGILPHYPAFLEAGAFRARFEAKGRYWDFMRRTPTDVVLHEQPGLLGAAAALFPPLRLPSMKAV